MARRINRHSRGAIDRAGDILRQSIRGNFTAYLEAYQVMDDWRASHSFPLNTFAVSLRRRAKSIAPDAEVFQRLKRAPSIIQKLRRFDDMKLSRMQDLGGCRAIFPALGNIAELHGAYREARDRHIVANEKDYTQIPKESGYRGHHIIYRYRSDRSDVYNDHRVEIQLRIRVQHYWSTAVEVAGVFVRSPLKSSIGPDDWLEYFKYASSLFAVIEDTPRLHSDLPDQVILERFMELDERLGAEGSLRRFSQSHSLLREHITPGWTHFVLTLDVDTNALTIDSFRSAAEASRRYAEIERQELQEANFDAVLVAADSVDSLARGYPNYFSDTVAFTDTVNEAVRQIRREA